MRIAVVLVLFAALVLPLSGSPTFAQGIGNVTITPTRVVFEKRTRSEVISLLNNGSESATYRVSVVNMRMLDNGSFERIEEGEERDGELFAKGMFRYAPRQVVLEPGAVQRLRILLRKPPDLIEGEYRSHLFIQAVPKEGSGRSIEAATGQGGFSIQLTIIPGVTLPIIVRHGSLSATATLSDFSLTPAGDEKAAPELVLRINRSGNRSLYGDLVATYFPAGQKNGIVVSQINLIAIYTPNASRSVTMRLTVPEDVELATGKIEVTYSTPPPEGAVLMASGEFAIP